MNRLFPLMLIFFGGTVFGPIIWAAIVAALPPGGDWGRENPHEQREREINLMMDAAATRVLQSDYIVMKSMLSPPDGRECGYDPEQVFPDRDSAFLDARRGRNYVDYMGYWMLDRWRSEQIDNAISSAIRSRMTISRFEAKFLRLCLQGTVLSELCADRIDLISSRAYDGLDRRIANRRYDFALFGNQDRVVCSFVDGVAARKGIRLSVQNDQQYGERDGGQF